MSVLGIIGLAVAGVAALLWLGVAALSARARWTIPALRGREWPAPARWPKVSLIVPARDEAAGLEAALRSKLALDYPALEVVLVDDRSTDATGAIADRLAAESPRLSVVHVRDLPKGWLGKVHALTKGVERATGEWLLFTDADIHYEPETLRRAVALCEAKGLDYLAALPRFISSTAAVNVAMSGFLPVVLSAVQTDWIEDPKSSASIGAGVFALVRASAYRKTPGLEHLKLEIADDVGLGQLMKQSGARCSVVAATDDLWLTMYTDFAGVVRGTAKAACAAGRYRVSLQLLVPSTGLVFTFAPWLALALGIAGAGPAWLALGALGAAGQLVASLIACRFSRLGAAWSLFAPLGLAALMGIILVTGLAAHVRGEIRWRDTAYSIADLKAASRFKFPWEA